MKSSSKATEITYTALMAAIVCLSTFLVRIPVPATAGYIHFGDAFVLLSGIFPGMWYGALAAGTGSCLADIFSGYALYSPASFVIKASCALIVSLIYKKMTTRIPSPSKRLLTGSILSAMIVTGGYLIFELPLYGKAAFLEIPMNLIQSGASIGISLSLFPFWQRIISRH